MTRSAEHDGDLPENWASTELRHLVEDVQPGFACGVHNRDGDGIGHLRPMNVTQEGQIDLSVLKFVSKTEVHRDERLIRAGDVLFNNTNSPELVGKTALYTLSEPRAFSNHMTRVRCSREAITPAFCALYLHHKWQTGYFLSVCNNHVSQASVGQNVLLDISVDLPPLAEQQRIVAKVEELLGRVGAARERLAKVPALLKRFRQSVLAAACSGQLTEDWRENNSCQSAATLLKELHRRQWHARGSKYMEPICPKVEEDCEIPEGWEFTGIDSILSIERRGMKTGPFGTALKKSEHQECGVPVLGIENIGKMRFIHGSKIHITQAKAVELAEYDARPCDILISRSGTVGEVCVVPAGLGEARISTNIMRVCLAVRGMEPRFFCCLVNGSPYVLSQISRLCGGSTRDFLNQTILRSLRLTLPPWDEQQEIIRRVETLFTLADKIEARVKSATARVEKSTQAILAKAFHGELVPTEAKLARQEGRDYEPASVLLERIRRQRDAESDGKVHRKQKVGKSPRRKG